MPSGDGTFVSYRNLSVPDGSDAAKKQLFWIVDAAARAIEARDGGSMLLDERKGLIGAEAVRRRPDRDEKPAS